MANEQTVVKQLKNLYGENEEKIKSGVELLKQQDKNLYDRLKKGAEAGDISEVAKDIEKKFGDPKDLFGAQRERDLLGEPNKELDVKKKDLTPQGSEIEEIRKETKDKQDKDKQDRDIGPRETKIETTKKGQDKDLDLDTTTKELSKKLKQGELSTEDFNTRIEKLKQRKQATQDQFQKQKIDATIDLYEKVKRNVNEINQKTQEIAREIELKKDQYENPDEVLNDVKTFRNKVNEEIAENNGELPKNWKESVAQKLGWSKQKVEDFQNKQYGKYLEGKTPKQEERKEEYQQELQDAKKEYERKKQDLNTELERTRERFNKEIERTKEEVQRQNNASRRLAAITGIGFSTRGIEGFEQVLENGRNAINDLVTKKEQTLNDIKKRKKRLTEDYEQLTKETRTNMKEDINNLKNNLFSEIQDIQDKYGNYSQEALNNINGAVQDFNDTIENINDERVKEFKEKTNELVEANQKLDELNEKQKQQQLNFYERKKQEGQINNSTVEDVKKWVDREQITPEMGDEIINNMIQDTVTGMNDLYENVNLGNKNIEDIESKLKEGKTPNQVVQEILEQPATKKIIKESSGSTADDLSTKTYSEDGKIVSVATNEKGEIVNKEVFDVGKNGESTIGAVEEGMKENFSSKQLQSRANRHNNPTVMTTDVAEDMGLVKGKDYIQGDPFKTEKGRTLYTAKIIGDPIETTIEAIDNGGFKTSDGTPRWSYLDNIKGPDGKPITDKKWNTLSKSEKVDIIRQMYAHEESRAGLQNFKGFTDISKKTKIDKLMSSSEREAVARGIALQLYGGKVSNEETKGIVNIMKSNPDWDGKKVLKVLRRFNIDDPKDTEFANNVLTQGRAITDLPNLDLPGLASLINKKEYGKAVKKIENQAISQAISDGVIPSDITEAGAKNTIERTLLIKKQFQKAKEQLNITGPFEGTLQQLLGKLQDAGAAKLAANLAFNFKSISEDLTTGELSDREQQLLKPLSIDLSDKVANAAGKANAIIGETFRTYNNIRESANLEPLENIEQLFDEEKRAKLYGFDPNVEYEDQGIKIQRGDGTETTINLKEDIIEKGVNSNSTKYGENIDNEKAKEAAERFSN